MQKYVRLGNDILYLRKRIGAYRCILGKEVCKEARCNKGKQRGSQSRLQLLREYRRYGKPDAGRNCTNAKGQVQKHHRKHSNRMGIVGSCRKSRASFVLGFLSYHTGNRYPCRIGKTQVFGSKSLPSRRRNCGNMFCNRSIICRSNGLHLYFRSGIVVKERSNRLGGHGRVTTCDCRCSKRRSFDRIAYKDRAIRPQSSLVRT